jgi:DNA-binding response OmpR family regulator
MIKADDKTILLLEDQLLIAMDTEDILKRSGTWQIVHFPQLPPALDWLSLSRPDAVVMEVNLQGESCVPLAQQLTDQNIPFLVYSGANRQLTDYQPVFRNTEWISKPTEPEIIGAALSRLLDRR